MLQPSSINRSSYIEKILTSHKNPKVEFISGIRASGKTHIVKEAILELRKNPDYDIFYFDAEDFRNRKFLQTKSFIDFLNQQRQNDKFLHLFLDEFQNFDDSTKTLSQIRKLKNIKLYLISSQPLTASHKKILNHDYKEISVELLSFKEYATYFPDEPDYYKLYETYLNYSSFPYATTLFRSNPEAISAYLKSTYNTMIFKDTIARAKIKQPNTLEDIVDYVYDNIANNFTPNSIANWLSLHRRKANNRTIEGYIKNLEESHILFRVNRFDIKRNKIKPFATKYFSPDLAFSRLLSSDLPANPNRLLENVIYLELRRRYSEVFVGEQDKNAPNFIARRCSGELDFYQVSAFVRNPDASSKKMATLNHINKENKILLSFSPDNLAPKDLVQKNIINWLLEA